MGFAPASRDWTMVKMPKKAATTYSANSFIYDDGTNAVPVVDATQNGVIGILSVASASTVATTDIYIRVPNSNMSTFYGDMESGETLDRANVGAFFDFATGSASDLGITISTASTYDTVQLVKYISTTKGVFRLNQTYGVEN